MPCALNKFSQPARGAVSIRIGRSSAYEKLTAISLGVMRRGPSSSTTLRPVQFS